jgi:hypothetical protein
MLPVFDWKKMNSDESDINCPPAKAPRRSKMKEMKIVEYPVNN